MVNLDKLFDASTERVETIEDQIRDIIDEIDRKEFAAKITKTMPKDQILRYFPDIYTPNDTYKGRTNTSLYQELYHLHLTRIFQLEALSRRTMQRGWEAHQRRREIPCCNVADSYGHDGFCWAVRNNGRIENQIYTYRQIIKICRPGNIKRIIQLREQAGKYDIESYLGDTGNEFLKGQYKK